MPAKFIERSQALLHGDMHTGSLMVTQDTTYAIDAEFAVYGPIAFDIGKFMANLLLAFFALDGHSTAADTRSKQRGWLYQVTLRVLFGVHNMTSASVSQHLQQTMWLALPVNYTVCLTMLFLWRSCGLIVVQP